MRARVDIPLWVKIVETTESHMGEKTPEDFFSREELLAVVVKDVYQTRELAERQIVLNYAFDTAIQVVRRKGHGLKSDISPKIFEDFHTNHQKGVSAFLDRVYC
ncbi:hypothetical protein COV17_03355 [Candidatus Woesearchaeota archaeon CG10_big_fil_rev_8_21_14_0_10_36_11]|nr:MAG: hypothetical protein COV17_03355 [Candidatus Woesearchaeota archaeon CG10_big_fil_rev_8_21_14_0_10_36_11]